MISTCNFKCYFCESRILNKDLKRTMTISELKNILDDCKKLQITHLNITPSTGELFLDTGIYDKLDLIKKYPFKEIKFNTNGSLLDVDKLKNCIDERFKVSISYYGINNFDEFKYLTQSSKNDYIKIEENIKLLKDNNIWFKLDDRSLSGHFYTTENKNDKTLNEKYRFNQRGLEFKNFKEQMCSNIFYPRIDVFGNFIFCSCSNPFHKIFKEQIIGNVFETSLSELYFSEKRLTLMKNLLKKDIPDFCLNCDSYNKVGNIKLNTIYLKKFIKQNDNSN